MLEGMMAAIIVILVMILITLLALLRLWRHELNYQNRGVLACLPEINASLIAFTGDGHLNHTFAQDGQIHEVFQKLDAIEGLLQELDTTTSPFRDAEFPGMPRRKSSLDEY